MTAMPAWGLILFLLISLAACDESMSAGADFDRDADFPTYHSFAWEEADLLPVGDPRLDGNPFFIERIHNAVSTELVARGLERVETGPSLLVDVVDAETLRVVWQGWARADVTRLIGQPEALERLVEEAARAMFQHFPRELVSREP
jgi:hypothetical protein